MKFCESCGSKLEEKALYCSKCGHKNPKVKEETK